jgi:hypothetical protein
MLGSLDEMKIILNFGKQPNFIRLQDVDVWRFEGKIINQLFDADLGLESYKESSKKFYSLVDKDVLLELKALPCYLG